ncbi:MAG: polysaccharide biosynthesis/export family protein [Gammaproteobacteria bacterium]|jgi:protein involved in polysaccharide export with SLBB domain
MLRIKLTSILFAIFAITLTLSVSAQQVVQSNPAVESTQQSRAMIDSRNTIGSRVEPFGSNLFKGSFFVAEREDGLNADYLIQQGDRITLQIWGALNLNDMTVVDSQGNIFIPEVGPIQVAGVRNAQLNNVITAAIRQVFTQNVNVYTNLQGTTPVIVFVTGFVNRPGSYAGTASDSVLYFLERAGGIDLNRGSYREIHVLRNNETILTADLYDFLLNGVLQRPQLTDGDTIVVGIRGSTVAAEGAVRNSYSFEIPEQGISGGELINYARPLANATYATVLGTRNNLPFSDYITLDQLESMTLNDGDQVLFEIDQVHDTILVRVEGAHLGQSRFALPRNTHLLDILDRIEIDPALGDINSLSMRRESIRIRQKQAIQDSLNRLETAILGRTSVTAEGAQIQLSEAQLMSDFVKRARQVEPQGILVVAKDGDIANPLLQPEDVIFIPQQTNVVQVSGEVMVPQALVFEPDFNLNDYIERVGGYTTHADKGKHMLLRRNGEVIPVFGSPKNINIKPGDEIISLPAVPSKSIDIIRMVTDTVYKIAASAAIFVRF